MLPAIPTPIPMPFAQNGERRAIPETNTTPGSADASWAAGFPPVTRINKQAGGKPPYGLDFQGIFHTICEHLFFSQSGNTPPWVGAGDGQPGLNYLKGAIVQGSDGENYMALKPSGPDAPNPDGTGNVGPVDPVGDESGHWKSLKSLFGGMYNSDKWITESGTFTAPVEGWYDVWLIDGGSGGAIPTINSQSRGGHSGAMGAHLVYLEAGQEVPVVIGAGSEGVISTTGMRILGGETSFAGLKAFPNCRFIGGLTPLVNGYSSESGAGLGGGIGDFPGLDGQAGSGAWYGAGGDAYVSTSSNEKIVHSGAQGAVYLRWHDPDKAGGPLPEPALLSAPRMAPRAVAEPATVNLYDPATGQGSVWREEDAEAQLEKGLITEEAWREICAKKAAKEYDAWLTSPDTEAERFEMLRAARKVKLADYDAAVAELRREERAGADVTAALAAWDAYANALCELPQQPGAPWDGGGQGTPWPEKPGEEPKGAEAH